MFRYEAVPPEPTNRSHEWYTVDDDRSLWLKSDGMTPGMEGRPTFVLCVRGTRHTFEIDDGVTVDGARVDRIANLRVSYDPAFPFGVPPRLHPEPDAALALQKLAAEALLVHETGWRARSGLAFESLRVQISAGDGPVLGLADFGYGDVPTDGAATD